MVQPAGIWQAAAGTTPHWDLQISPDAACLWTSALMLTHKMGTGVYNTELKLITIINLRGKPKVFSHSLPFFLFECVFCLQFSYKIFFVGVALGYLGVALFMVGVVPTTPFIYKVTHVRTALP